MYMHLQRRVVRSGKLTMLETSHGERNEDNIETVAVVRSELASSSQLRTFILLINRHVINNTLSVNG